MIATSSKPGSPPSFEHSAVTLPPNLANAASTSATVRSAPEGLERHGKSGIQPLFRRESREDVFVGSDFRRRFLHCEGSTATRRGAPLPESVRRCRLPRFAEQAQF